MKRLILLFAVAGCASMPPETTAQVSVLNEHQAEALRRSREQNTANLRTLAERLRKENAARIEARFVERLGPDSRPTSEVLTEVAARDAALAASGAEVDAALAAALKDDNAEAAAEINAAVADYLAEETERQKAERRVRALLKIGAKK